MRRGLLVGALAALLLAAVGSAAPEKSPRVSLTARPSTLVAGRPWTAVLAVRGSQPARVALTATLGHRRVVTTARKWRRGRYRARLVFPAPGRWRLAAKIGRTRVPLGAVAVRAATRPPLVLVAPTEAVLEPNGSILVAESGQSRLARIDPRIVGDFDGEADLATKRVHHDMGGHAVFDICPRARVGDRFWGARTAREDEPIPAASEDEVLEETARLAREGRKELDSDPRERKPESQ